MSTDKKIQSCICFPNETTQQVSLTYNENPSSSETTPIEIVSTTVPLTNPQDHENIKKMNEIYNYLTTIETQTPSFHLVFKKDTLTSKYILTNIIDVFDLTKKIQIQQGLFEGIDNLETLIQKINTLINDIRQSNSLSSSQMKPVSSSKPSVVNSDTKKSIDPNLQSETFIPKDISDEYSKTKILVGDITKQYSEISLKFESGIIKKDNNIITLKIGALTSNIKEDVKKQAMSVINEIIDNFKKNINDLKILKDKMIDTVGNIKKIKDKLTEYINQNKNIDESDVNIKEILSFCNFAIQFLDERIPILENIETSVIPGIEEKIEEIEKKIEEIEAKIKEKEGENDKSKIEEIKTKLESPSNTSVSESAELSTMQNSQKSLSSGGNYINNSKRKRTTKRKNRKFRKTRAIK